jgi:hypothetical protein
MVQLSEAKPLYRQITKEGKCFKVHSIALVSGYIFTRQPTSECTILLNARVYICRIIVDLWEHHSLSVLFSTYQVMKASFYFSSLDSAFDGLQNPTILKIKKAGPLKKCRTTQWKLCQFCVQNNVLVLSFLYEVMEASLYYSALDSTFDGLQNPIILRIKKTKPLERNRHTSFWRSPGESCHFMS